MASENDQADEGLMALASSVRDLEKYIACVDSEVAKIAERRGNNRIDLKGYTDFARKLLAMQEDTCCHFREVITRKNDTKDEDIALTLRKTLINQISEIERQLATAVSEDPKETN